MKSGLLRSSLLSLTCVGAFGACQLDSFEPGEGVMRIPNEDPAKDVRLDQLGIICESDYIVTGTFVPGAVAQPEDMNGCWAVGTWTITATPEFVGCSPQPEVPTDLVYEVTFDEEASTINVTYVSDPSAERVNLKISTAGDGLCHGSMEHFGLDFGVWSVNPTLQLDNTLLGIGKYSLYDAEPF